MRGLHKQYLTISQEQPFPKHQLDFFHKLQSHIQCPILDLPHATVANLKACRCRVGQRMDLCGLWFCEVHLGVG